MLWNFADDYQQLPARQLEIPSPLQPLRFASGLFALALLPSIRTSVSMRLNWPLTMPLAQAGEPFILSDLSLPTFKHLPTLLADALPDDFGNALIDAWMASEGMVKDAITPPIASPA